MPDLGWSSHAARLDHTAYLEALSVERTQDEFGQDRYFVVDGTTGDWISDAFDTADLAFDERDRIRAES